MTKLNLRSFNDGVRAVLSPRAILAWLLYAVGFAAYVINDELLPARFWREWLFNLYQRSMDLSDRVQGRGPGPWQAPDDEG